MCVYSTEIRGFNDKTNDVKVCGSECVTKSRTLGI